MDGARGSGALLVACALGIERFALRGGGRAGAAGPVTVLRTGMGARAAERAVVRALREGGVAPDAAVVATGFCAGLAPGMHPGDVVVADTACDALGRTVCTESAGLARALAAGRRGGSGAVHVGRLVGCDRVIRGPERARLAATGAVAADMESAATLRTALSIGPRPVAAVRVVVDAPEHELVRIGTLRGGISAFRVLRDVLPAIVEWHRSLLHPQEVS